MVDINAPRSAGTGTAAPVLPATMTHRSPSHIPCLDGIRAVAALMVMVFHFVGHHGEPARLVQASVIGQTGVDLFFVLSGFLITRILLVLRPSCATHLPPLLRLSRGLFFPAAGAFQGEHTALLHPGVVVVLSPEHPRHVRQPQE